MFVAVCWCLVQTPVVAREIQDGKAASDATAASDTAAASNATTTPPRWDLFQRILLGPLSRDPDFTVTDGVSFSNEDLGLTLNLGGRIFLDAAYYFEDGNRDLTDSFGFQDVRLEAESTLGDDWSSRLSLGVSLDDSRSIDLSIKDIYVRYLGFSPIEFTVGQQKEPFSLEEITSSRRLIFLQRALPNTFPPSTSLGFAVRTHGERWTANAGGFIRGIGVDQNHGDQGFGLSGRFTTSPILEEDHVLHLGGSVSLRKAASDDDVSYSSRPEVGIADFKFVNTGRIEGADRIRTMGIEGAYIHGPYFLQGELMLANVGRQDGFADTWFNGLYVMGSWFVTGESRSYLHKIGTFGSITPTHRLGAVELAARYSRIDLTSKDIKGGVEQNVTLGLNWYIRRQVRLMANYVLVWADAAADGNGTLTGGDSSQIFQVRLQVSF